MTSAAIDMELSIDKSDWKPCCLGDVVEESRLVARDPVKEGIEKVVGLEHIDSESIHLKRWETLEQSTTFTKKFVKGQVLFGRRRAYLKKAALATFDGICSGDITVLQAKEGLLPEMLPFLINNDKFFDFAIKNSAGSLSPRVKFKDLANFKFFLPPKKEQARIASLFGAADGVKVSTEELCNTLQTLKARLCSHYFTEGANSIKTKNFGSHKIPFHWSIEPIHKFASVEYGISESVANNKDSNLGWPILTGANITIDGKLDLTKKVFIEIPSNEKFFLSKGDLLFNWRSGSPEHVGKTAIFDLLGNYTYASFVLRIRCGERLSHKFAYYMLNHLRAIEYFTKDIAQQVNFKMNAAVFRQVEIPVPPLQEQEQIVNRLDQIQHEFEKAAFHNTKFIQLQKILINHIF